MMRPSMTILSFSLRDRISMVVSRSHLLYNSIVKWRTGFDGQNSAGRALGALAAGIRREGGDEALHEFKRPSQQRLVLCCPVTNALQQLVIFIYQGVDQWPVMLCQ